MRDNLHRRLKKIIGQLQAIDRMVDEDVPCEDILAQMNAAKSAIHKCGQIVLEGHIKHCVRDGSSTETRTRPSPILPRRWSGFPICPDVAILSRHCALSSGFRPCEQSVEFRAAVSVAVDFRSAVLPQQVQIQGGKKNALRIPGFQDAGVPGILHVRQIGHAVKDNGNGRCSRAVPQDSCRWRWRSCFHRLCPAAERAG